MGGIVAAIACAVSLPGVVIPPAAIYWYRFSCLGGAVIRVKHTMMALIGTLILLVLLEAILCSAEYTVQSFNVGALLLHPTGFVKAALSLAVAVPIVVFLF